MLGGFHIEEDIYGPLYYYPGQRVHETRQYETEMPEDTILVHLRAGAEVIELRMNNNPHDYQIVKMDNVPMLLDRFAEHYAESTLKHKIEIDTSDLTPDRLLDVFFDRVVPHLNTRDILLVLGEKLGLQSRPS